MKTVTVYSKNNCPYCVAAKNLLADKKIDFKEIILDTTSNETIELKNKTGQMTFPQIFIGDDFIGGYSELSALEDTDQLQTKLNF